MDKKTRIIIAIFLLAFLSVFAYIKLKNRKDSDPYKMFRIFAKVYDIVISKYVEPVDQSKLILGAYRGGVQSLNQNNSYIPSKLMDKIKDRFNMKGSIGIKVTKKGNYAQVVYSNPESEAYKEGIKPGTIIRKINSMQAFNMSLYELEAMLHGKIGEKVAIDFYSSDFSKDIEKQFIYKQYPEVSYRIETIDRQKVFKLYGFTEESFKALKEYLKNSNIPVIDIRYSSDDNYREMVQFASYLKKRPVTILRKTKDGEKEITSNIKSKYEDNKIIFIATSSLTMDAAEVFANTLKGNKNIILVGGKTAGQAYKFTTFKLENGDYINIATEVYTPLNKKGLLPDLRSFVDDDEIINTIRKYLKELKSNGKQKKAA